MKVSPTVLVFFGAFVSFVSCASFALWPASASADGACIDCHSQLRPPLRRAPALNLLHDAHRTEGVSCITCHGGEDTPSVRAHAARAGFIAKPVGACIGCHMGHEERSWWETQSQGSSRDGGMSTDGGADARVDVDAGVAVDGGTSAEPSRDPGAGDPAESQISSLYLTSAHAASHLAGAAGATCGDCHRPHGALSPDEPASSVHWTSIPGTCSRCHHDAAVVGEELQDPMSRWARSVHGGTWAARLEDDERHGPGCADCHDPHGNRAGEEAVGACVTCHEEARAAFDAGPHAEAFLRRGFLDCVECHGSHEILSADSSLITAGREAACRRCHRPDQEVYEQIGALGASLEAADAARHRIARGDEALQGEARELSMELVDAVHRLDVEEVETHTAALAVLASRAPEPSPEGDADVAGEAVDTEVGAPRPLTLVGVAVLIGLGFTLAWRRRRSGR